MSACNHDCPVFEECGYEYKLNCECVQQRKFKPMPAPAAEEPQKVLEFKLHKEPGNIELRRTNYGVDCEHRQLMLDYPGRTIICQKCNITLDPYRALKLVQGWMEEKNYKYERILEYEKKEAEKRKKEHEKREKLNNERRTRSEGLQPPPVL